MARRKGLSFYQKKKKLNVVIIREIMSWIFWIFASMLVAVVTMFCVGMRTSVIGSSMEPGLYNGQKIFLNRIVYGVSSPKEGDVVVFLPNGNEKSHYYVKRVVGVPGDTLYIKNGILYVNGDNCNNSEDSRSANIGTVKKEYIIGKAWFKMASGDSDIGFVE